jgi:hypothetical protein
VTTAISFRFFLKKEKEKFAAGRLHEFGGQERAGEVKKTKHFP